MQCEILEYKYTTEWDIPGFLSDPVLLEKINPDWPLITSTFSPYSIEADQEARAKFAAGVKRCKPSIFKNSTIHNTTNVVGEILKSRKEIVNIQGACAGSLYALHLASLMSFEKQTPVVVFCGDNFVNSDYHLWHFQSIGALDNEVGKPFDSSSKGFAMGSGVVLMIIKHPSVKCVLDTKAVIQNFSFYTESKNFSQPVDLDALIKNMNHIDYDKIDFWNAHATGTPVGDIVEYNYFNQSCKKEIPIVSFKGYVGHCMSAAGAIEIAMALDCKKNNLLKPNLIVGDKIVNDDRIITMPISFTYKRMLKTSFAFGGKNVVIEIDLL
jgi:3-oxoacyl-(acyl-carrier-protein) synthase